MVAAMGFDFDAAVTAPFRMQPGLRRMAAGEPHLTPSVAPRRGVARHLREKLAVLSAFAGCALLARPGFDARPCVDALSRHAAVEQPEAFAFDGSRLTARWLGWSIDADDEAHAVDSAWPEVGACLAALPAPWRRAALLSLGVEEDFAIVDGNDGTIPWLAVALPSHWAPEQKVGRSFAAVHAPVADSQRIVAAAAHLARLVTGNDSWERFVWTITRHPRLHAHPARVDPGRWPDGVDGDALAQLAWWRTERQTFIPLPERHQAIFTIQVDVQPLAAALAAPARAARVHDALASMSDAVLDYRGLRPVRDRLLRWLAARGHDSDVNRP